MLIHHHYWWCTTAIRGASWDSSALFHSMKHMQGKSKVHVQQHCKLGILLERKRGSRGSGGDGCLLLVGFCRLSISPTRSVCPVRSDRLLRPHRLWNNQNRPGSFASIMLYAALIVALQLYSASCEVLTSAPCTRPPSRTATQEMPEISPPWIVSSLSVRGREKNQGPLILPRSH